MPGWFEIFISAEEKGNSEDFVRKDLLRPRLRRISFVFLVESLLIPLARALYYSLLTLSPFLYMRLRGNDYRHKNCGPLLSLFPLSVFFHFTSFD